MAVCAAHAAGEVKAFVSLDAGLQARPMLGEVLGARGLEGKDAMFVANDKRRRSDAWRCLLQSLQAQFGVVCFSGCLGGAGEKLEVTCTVATFVRSYHNVGVVFPSTGRGPRDPGISGFAAQLPAACPCGVYMHVAVAPKPDWSDNLYSPRAECLHICFACASIMRQTVMPHRTRHSHLLMFVLYACM